MYKTDMITLKELKEILILKESGTDDQTIANIFNIKTESVKKYFLKGKKIIERTMDEADDAAGTTSTGGSAGTSAPAGPSNVTKWSGAAEGRANPRTSSRKWESGITRSKANPLN